MRLKSPVPRAREVKYALRMIILAQFFKPSKRGSYEIDDSVQLAEYISSRSGVFNSLQELEADTVVPNLSPEEQESRHYLAGYVVRNVIRKHKLCYKYAAAVRGANSDSGRLLALKKYVEGKQCPCIPSQPVVTLLQNAEGYFIANE